MAKKLNVLISDRVEESFDEIGELIRSRPIGAELAKQLDLPEDWEGGVEEGGNARLRVEIALLLASRMTREELLSAVMELNRVEVVA